MADYYYTATTNILYGVGQTYQQGQWTIVNQPPVTPPAPPAARTTRRGDTPNTGMRRIKGDTVRFKGHNYTLLPAQHDPEYTGQLDGVRAVFWVTTRYIPGMGYTHDEIIQLAEIYDPPDAGKLPLGCWRYWYRLDVFED